MHGQNHIKFTNLYLQSIYVFFFTRPEMTKYFYAKFSPKRKEQFMISRKVLYISILYCN